MSSKYRDETDGREDSLMMWPRFVVHPFVIKWLNLPWLVLRLVSFTTVRCVCLWPFQMDNQPKLLMHPIHTVWQHYSIDNNRIVVVVVVAVVVVEVSCLDHIGTCRKVYKQTIIRIIHDKLSQCLSPYRRPLSSHNVRIDYDWMGTYNQHKSSPLQVSLNRFGST